MGHNVDKIRSELNRQYKNLLGEQEASAHEAHLLQHALGQRYVLQQAESEVIGDKTRCL